MAAPTIDSQNPPTGGAGFPGADITSGPGSKTPTPSPFGLSDTPLGGVPPVKPIGAPGAPKKAPGPVLEPLDEESFEVLVDDIYRAIDDNKVQAKSVEEIIDYLLGSSWSEKRILKLSKYLKCSIKDMVFSIKEHVLKDGVNKTIDSIKNKINKIKEKEVLEEAVSSGIAQPLEPLPLKGAGLDLGILTDVDLNFIKLRGLDMGKVIVKEGSVVDSTEYSKEIIGNISSAIRKVKSSIKELNELKVKYAGVMALKEAVEQVDKDAAGMGSGLGAGPVGMPFASGADAEVGPAEPSSGVSSDVKETLEDIKDQIGDIKDIVEDIADKKEDLKGETEELKDVIDEGKEEAKKLPAEDAESVEEKLAEAKEILKEARRKCSEDSSMFGKLFEKKEDKKEEKDEKKKDEKDKKEDDKKDDDKKEDKDKKEEKKSSIDVETLLKKVRARIEELRSEKEANLYPFKKEVKPIPPVDNINSDTAKNQKSTVDKEIKKDPVQDKGHQNMNPQESLATLSVKEDKGTKGEKHVSMEVAERVKKRSVDAAVSQARLSVELAARQQLKGLIEDPLKTALYKNIIEAGLDQESADAIIHNAYIDAYEESHKTLIKEAFDNFMTKDYDEFVKIAEFVDNYTVKQAFSSVENTDETFRDKEASAAPLRGFSTDKDFNKEVYKSYWQDVKRKQRGIVP